MVPCLHFQSLWGSTKQCHGRMTTLPVSLEFTRQCRGPMTTLLVSLEFKRQCRGPMTTLLVSLEFNKAVSWSHDYISSISGVQQGSVVVPCLHFQYLWSSTKQCHGSMTTLPVSLEFNKAVSWSHDYTSSISGVQQGSVVVP